MKKLCFAVLLLCATVGYAMPIASSARAMVPAELQQLIGVDYRALKDSATAQALKDKVMPQNLKEFPRCICDLLDEFTFCYERMQAGQAGEGADEVVRNGGTGKIVDKPAQRCALLHPFEKAHNVTGRRGDGRRAN